MVKKSKEEFDLDGLLDELDGMDLGNIDLGDDDDEEDDGDLDAALEVDDLEDEDEKPAAKETKPKRNRRSSKGNAKKATVSNDEVAKVEPEPAPSPDVEPDNKEAPTNATGEALQLISSALRLRRTQVGGSTLSEPAKKAAVEQLDYAEQVISLFLYN